MYAAIIDYYLNQITVFEIPNDIQDPAMYIESLPGYDITCCYYLTSNEPIQVRIGKQSQFPEFNAQA